MKNIFLARAISLAIVVFVSYVQAFHLLEFGGVNPNLAAAAILAASFFEKNMGVIILFLVAALAFLLPQPVITMDLILFSAIMVALIFFDRFAPWPPVFLLPLTVAVFTAVFYFVTVPGYLLQNYLLAAAEALYNVLVAYLFLVIFELIYETKKT